RSNRAWGKSRGLGYQCRSGEGARPCEGVPFLSTAFVAARDSQGETMKKIERPWKIVMVLLLVATAASIIKNRPISVRGFDATGAPPDQTKADWYHQGVVKMTLDGKIVLSIPAIAFPDKYRIKRDGTSFMRLSGLTVAPNGDIYVTDGYASDYIHRFDKTGKYIASFGGKQPPYGFRTLHRIAIDSRFEPARLIATDRENGRLVHLSLDGHVLGVIKE